MANSSNFASIFTGRSTELGLTNKNNPKPPSLSDMDLAVAEGYLQELLLCLPVLGVSFDKISANETPSENQLFIKTSKGIKATGAQTDSGFTIFTGSQATIDKANSIPPALEAKRKELSSKGVLKDSGKNYYEFACDFTFGSPSTAAGVVLGRSANGLTEWKDKNGVSLKMQEDKYLNQGSEKQN